MRLISNLTRNCHYVHRMGISPFKLIVDHILYIGRLSHVYEQTKYNEIKFRLNMYWKDECFMEYMYRDKHKVCIWIFNLYKKWSTDLSNDINSRSIFCESTGAELLQSESFSFFSLTHSSNVVCPLFTFVCTHSLDLANVFACLSANVL